MHSLNQLVPRWLEESTGLLPPESPDTVRDVFVSLGWMASADVVALYGRLGGMSQMDNEYWRMWSLDEIAEQPPSEFGVVFSDDLISCWEYRLKPVSPGQSAVYADHFNGNPPLLVADSLEAFFARYAASARALLVEDSVQAM